MFHPPGGVYFIPLGSISSRKSFHRNKIALEHPSFVFPDFDFSSVYFNNVSSAKTFAARFEDEFSTIVVSLALVLVFYSSVRQWLLLQRKQILEVALLQLAAIPSTNPANTSSVEATKSVVNKVDIWFLKKCTKKLSNYSFPISFRRKSPMTIPSFDDLPAGTWSYTTCVQQHNWRKQLPLPCSFLQATQQD
jgi:hypothetical protein